MNPAVARVRSSAEEIQVAELDGALRHLPYVEVEEREALESLSRRLLGELSAPSAAFAAQTGKTLPNQRRLPITCETLDARGAACLGAYFGAAVGLRAERHRAHLCAAAPNAAIQRRASRAP